MHTTFSQAARGARYCHVARGVEILLQEVAIDTQKRDLSFWRELVCPRVLILPRIATQTSAAHSARATPCSRDRPPPPPCARPPARARAQSMALEARVVRAMLARRVWAGLKTV